MNLLAIILPILLLSASAHAEVTIQRLTVPESVGCPVGMHSDGLVYTTNPPVLDCYPGPPASSIFFDAVEREAPAPRLSVLLGVDAEGQKIWSDMLPLSLACLFL